MLKVVVKQHAIQIGDRFMLSLQRTLRIPNDGKIYPLPPGLGVFPIYPVSDYSESLPADWNQDNHFFIPMYQREALWFGFIAAEWKPNAVMVGIGKVNAVSGESNLNFLHNDLQNYLVCPPQPWLDGINFGDGSIRQFVAMPLGLGVTVEAEITGREIAGAIQVKVFDAKEGVFPEQPPAERKQEPVRSAAMSGMSVMGLAAGGQMKQKIYPDPYGIDVWDMDNFGELTIHIVNSKMFHDITGQKCPSTPVDTAAYTNHGFPWFDLYDEKEADVSPPESLAKIKGLEDIDTSVDINIRDTQIEKLGKKGV